MLTKDLGKYFLKKMDFVFAQNKTKQKEDKNKFWNKAKLNKY